MYCVTREVRVESTDGARMFIAIHILTFSVLFNILIFFSLIGAKMRVG